MSDLMSLEQIQTVVDNSNGKVLTEIAHLNRNLSEFKQEFKIAKNDLGEAMTKYQVIENDFKNHKEQQIRDNEEFDKSLSENWTKTRKMESFINKWIGGGLVVSGILSTAALIITIYNKITN